MSNDTAGQGWMVLLAEPQQANIPPHVARGGPERSTTTRRGGGSGSGGVYKNNMQATCRKM